MRYIVTVIILFVSCAKDKSALVVDTSKYPQLIVGTWKETLSPTSDDYDKMVFDTNGKYSLFHVSPWLNPREAVIRNEYSYSLNRANLNLQIDSMGNTINYTITNLNEKELIYKDGGGVSYSWNK